MPSRKASVLDPVADPKPASRSRSRKAAPPTTEPLVEEVGAPMPWDVSFRPKGAPSATLTELLPHSFRPLAARPTPETIAEGGLVYGFRPLKDARKDARPARAVAAPPREPEAETSSAPARGSRKPAPAPKARFLVSLDADFDLDDLVSVESSPEISPVKVEPEAPVAPPKPPKPDYIVRPQAPQVVLREGIPTLVRDGRVFAPFALAVGAYDPRKDETILEEIRLATQSGVRIATFGLTLDVEPQGDLALLERALHLLRAAVRIHAELQVIFRVSFEAPRGWADRFPDGKFRREDGSPALPSISDDGFWGEAETLLTAFVGGLLEDPDAGSILGLHLDRDQWFLAPEDGYDDSRAAERKFRDWTRTRYGNDVVALRASWFASDVSFDTVKIPKRPAQPKPGDPFVRSGRRERPSVDYHLFLSDQTVARIERLALAVKKASHGDFLVGVNYGYTFEFSHPGSGHLALGKLLRAEEIDYISGPPSYRNRGPGQTGAFPVAIDSFALNGKLYLSEDDYKTSLGGGADDGDRHNPALGTPQALEAVHWRSVGAALAHGTGVQWTDTRGGGWLKTNSAWDRAQEVRRRLIERMGTPLGDPDVAIFIDERALAYLVDEEGFDLLVQNVRDSVMRAGISSAFYLLSDLAHRETFPESKLYIFLNAWDIRPELRSAIKSRLQKDGKVLFWLYAAGLFDAGRTALERARETMGIAIKPQPFRSRMGTTLIQRRHPLCEAFGQPTIAAKAELEPSYFAIPEDAYVLGEYSQTGLPSYVMKEFHDDEGEWTSIFLGEPVITPALIRALAQQAGAHVYGHQDDVIHVRSPFVTLHCGAAGTRTLSLPDKASAYHLIEGRYLENVGPGVKLTSVEGATHPLLVGPRSEIDALLQTQESDVLSMGELPEKIPNVRRDSRSFDVPLVSLGAMIENGDSDDLADDWFLRTPPQAAAPAEQAVASERREDRVGHRRRDRNKGRSQAAQPEYPMDEELNVMFRERK